MIHLESHDFSNTVTIAVSARTARVLFEHGNKLFHSCVTISAGLDEHGFHEPTAMITLFSKQGLRRIHTLFQGIERGHIHPSQPPCT
jgi:hypothetical protein